MGGRVCVGKQEGGWEEECVYMGQRYEKSD